jgi:hypothetical protein
VRLSSKFKRARLILDIACLIASPDRDYADQSTERPTYYLSTRLSLYLTSLSCNLWLERVETSTVLKILLSLSRAVATLL